MKKPRKTVVIEIELTSKCEDWQVDNIKEALDQCDGIKYVRRFDVTGFPEREDDVWGQ